MWKHCAWLVVDSFISAGKVVNCVISLQLLTHRIQVFRGARLTRILCISIKTRRVVICRLQVAGQNLKYARTVNAKLILRKKLSYSVTQNRKYLLSQEIVCLELDFAARSTIDQNFTLLKITTNGKKPGCEIPVVPRSGCPRRQNLICDAKSRRKCHAVSITLIIQFIPYNSNPQGKWKSRKVQVIGSSKKIAGSKEKTSF